MRLQVLSPTVLSTVGLWQKYRKRSSNKAGGIGPLGSSTRGVTRIRLQPASLTQIDPFMYSMYVQRAPALLSLIVSPSDRAGHEHPCDCFQYLSGRVKNAREC